LHENILEFLLPKYIYQKIYLSVKYNHTQLQFCGDGNQGWRELLSDLSSSALQNSGLHLLSNGGSKDRRVIKCGHSRKYQCLKTIPAESSYRVESLHADRNNSRGKNGKSMPRRTRTKRAEDNSSNCSFLINIKYDEFGFYIVGGRGQGCHNNHPRLLPTECRIPSRLMKLEEKSILRSIGVAKANDGVGRNVYFTRSGYVIPRSQVRYINGFRDDTESNPESNNSRQLLPGESSVDRLIQSLRNRGFAHCLLYHHKKPSAPVQKRKKVKGVKIASDGVVDSDFMLKDIVARTPSLNDELSHDVVNNIAAMTLPSLNDDLSHDVVDSDSMLNEIFDSEQMEVDAVSCNVTLEVTPLPMSEAADMQMFAQEHRNSLHVLDHQDLMIACAWTTPCEKRLFKMFSEVLHIDCTADTNIECRPLLTISGRDSCGSMFVVLRAFLPNERAWVFRWMFQTVMPRLLGPYLSRVKCIVTDGDSQETSQLDMAIENLFPNVCRVRCGWHIIDRGWKRVCPSSRAVRRGPNRRKFKLVRKLLKAWLYSWMKQDCETEQEYMISKALLIAYLGSPDFVAKFGDVVSEGITEFVRDNVEPHEANYCFHKRLHVRHFDTYTNCGHEGTNNGLKSSAAPVLPQHSLDRCALILNQNAAMKSRTKRIDSAVTVSTRPLWSTLPTSNKLLTSKGESIVATQWQLRHEYICEQVGDRCWHLLAKSTTTSPCDAADVLNLGDAIPCFSRVRRVEMLEGTNILLCSCMYFERTGIPCRHVMNVLDTICPGYNGISHHDVSVTWRSDFHKYAFSNDSSKQCLSKIYSELLFNDVRGPSIPDGVKVTNDIKNPSTLTIKPTIDTCQNYNAGTIKTALIQSGYYGRFDGDWEGGEDNISFGGAFNTQEETYMCGDDSDSIPFPTMLEIGPTDIVPVINGVLPSHDTPYGVLAPLFKELTSILGHNCSDEKVGKYKRFLSESIALEKEEFSSSKKNPSGNMISSSVGCNKRHKSHGTKHMI
jgi:hypothetical protein